MNCVGKEKKDTTCIPLKFLRADHAFREDLLQQRLWLVYLCHWNPYRNYGAGCSPPEPIFSPTNCLSFPWFRLTVGSENWTLLLDVWAIKVFDYSHSTLCHLSFYKLKMSMATFLFKESWGRSFQIICFLTVIRQSVEGLKDRRTCRHLPAIIISISKIHPCFVPARKFSYLQSPIQYTPFLLWECLSTLNRSWHKILEKTNWLILVWHKNSTGCTMQAWDIDKEATAIKRWCLQSSKH